MGIADHCSRSLLDLRAVRVIILIYALTIYSLYTTLAKASDLYASVCHGQC